VQVEDKQKCASLVAAKTKTTCATHKSAAIYCCKEMKETKKTSLMEIGIHEHCNSL